MPDEPAQPPRDADADAIGRLVSDALAAVASPGRPTRNDIARLLSTHAPPGRVVVAWFEPTSAAEGVRRAGPPLVVGSAVDSTTGWWHSLRTAAEDAVEGTATDVTSGRCIAVTRRAGSVAVVMMPAPGPSVATFAATLSAVAAGVATSSAEASPPPAVSPSQQRVLNLLLEGLTEREISERLALSKDAVHGRVRRLYRRFGVTSRPRLMAKLRQET